MPWPTNGVADVKAATRPLLRYHGGKWRIAPWIINHFPPHRCYVEPFGGGASVLLRKPRSYGEVYNDLNGELVNLFQVARDQGAALVRAIEMTPYSRREFDGSYAPSPDPLEQARRTLIRSLMGFGTNFFRPNKNGTICRTGFRTCTSRRGSTPASDWRRYPVNLTSVIERLQGVVIESRDALDIMATHDGVETLHYVDPPYLAETRNAGPDYSHDMTEKDHRRLAAFLKKLKGHVVVSGYASPLYEKLFRGWRTVTCQTLADGARPRTEVLWLRNIEGDLFS
jgi:DNA adenine methylase